MYTEYKVSFGNDINCSNDAITVATKSRWETVKVEHWLQVQKEFQWTVVLQTRAFQIIWQV
jgi:hypothetical protein